MPVSGVRSFGTDYAAAERFCDEWAGDTQSHVAVVEDFTMGNPGDPDSGEFLVMSYADAETYVGRNDAEIQYDADYRHREEA